MKLIALALSAFSATIVLDPGHGGAERGAVGPGGAAEADVVLAIARRTRRELAERGVRAILTRTGDENPTLAERIGRAHRIEANAFVSIHLNSSKVSGRRGVETYVASVLGGGVDSDALVAREEAGRVVERETRGPPLRRILDDLDAQAAHRQSAALAASIQESLATVDGLAPNRGLRQAPFFVLEQAQVPAVLVEAGYVTHEEQSRFLASRAGRAAVADRLAEGILRYLGGR